MNLLKIYPDQLRDGQRETIHLTLSPSILQLNEPEVHCNHPIHISGEAYLADDHLILKFIAHTEITMPCTICNEPAFVSIHTQDIYHSIPLTEIPSSVFDYTHLLREEIIILIPQFAECHSGNCPKRIHITPWMKQKISPSPRHFPFTDL